MIEMLIDIMNKRFLRKLNIKNKLISLINTDIRNNYDDCFQLIIAIMVIHMAKSYGQF